MTRWPRSCGQRWLGLLALLLEWSSRTVMKFKPFSVPVLNKHFPAKLELFLRVLKLRFAPHPPPPANLNLLSGLEGAHGRPPGPNQAQASTGRGVRQEESGTGFLVRGVRARGRVYASGNAEVSGSSRRGPHKTQLSSGLYLSQYR